MVVQYLTPHKSDAHARDADGWTALHNACSKGYLDIVRYLCESGGAISRSDGSSGVDARSKDGWTPLMNAASKGHLPVVRYLLTKHTADPLVRNNWGETAYDVAAAVFEVWICEILQQAEAAKWRNTTVPYNPLSVHTTVPLVLYENQRLDVRLKTVAVSGGRPKFSASGLGRHGRRPPFELKLPSPDEETNATIVAAWRSGVQLPLRSSPWNLPNPGSNDRATYDSADKSHFWLSDWTLDVTPPGVDAEEGWQYAHTFSDPDDQWTADRPPHLERILSGMGLMASGLGGRGSPSSSVRTPQTWVRRRRWVRIMRRRLDIPPMPFLEPDGAMYYFDSTGEAIPHMDEHPSDIAETDGQEMGSMPPSMLASARDYVARARYLVGRQPNESDSGPPTAIEARRAIAKLERATTELRQGILADDNSERKRQAEVLLNAYSRELERRRLSAGAQGLLISGLDDHLDSDDEDSDEEFRYPGVETSRPGSRSSGLVDSRSLGQRLPTDLTPQLSQAPEFRVPTHEAPQKVIGPRWTSPTPQQVHAQWERDETVQHCRECQRRFNFILRRHCRRCGRIFCDRCSSYRALLDPSDIVQDPLAPQTTASSSSQRVCLSCHDEVNATIPPRLQGTRVNSMERIIVEQARLTVPGHLNRGQTGSQLSDLAE
ncbi:hypothetical protein BDN72DRAFT_363853 [Pluteus cervinus]|uniref:Uncharacterized protein n=1 Tax=Pluteus cervinus TaxID=181527 RepID=A0ACD3BDM3_9AGAR|nr:hypothetical protein BDN72DRAFT_363853 [Pluteus cervinus]